MKNLKGYKKRYFKMAVIAMYSTINKLIKTTTNFQYHKKSYIIIKPSQAPPTNKNNLQKSS
ncbi:MAG: hypothetical protein B1H07_04910 [Campylobacteraceae bacterium 4484_166]|nr:MAG: hypothetical protein B1H07_04910 [Campylobacteraceae bacterium 4484_166]